MLIKWRIIRLKLLTIEVDVEHKRKQIHGNQNYQANPQNKPKYI